MRAGCWPVLRLVPVLKMPFACSMVRLITLFVFSHGPASSCNPAWCATMCIAAFYIFLGMYGVYCSFLIRI